MNEPDSKLRALLGQWPDIVPSGRFEQDVWRRIRLNRAELPSRPGWGEWLRGLAGRPTFAMAAAVVVALTIGAWAGREPVPHAQPGFAFLTSDSLAGGYLRLTGGTQ